MNTRTALMSAAGAAAIVAIPALAVAQGTFEGVITFQMNVGQAGPSIMQYSVKGRNVRMDIAAPGKSIFTLFNSTTRIVRIVIPMQQVYMERTVDPQADADSASRGTQHIVWTGRKETVAGYECEHAMAPEDDGTRTDVCLAKGLGTFVQMNGLGRGRGGPQAGGWEGYLGNDFPLKVQQGGRTMMEATKIEKKTLDASLFTIPDGYQKMSMSTPGR